ncbi:hypothetical protein THIOKS12660006 [Thiocapsa sp. KS1]|nr:hypothetical protein THIOKS12660006 [Thiocapsa sp. KS1]
MCTVTSKTTDSGAPSAQAGDPLSQPHRIHAGRETPAVFDGPRQKPEPQRRSGIEGRRPLESNLEIQSRVIHGQARTHGRGDRDLAHVNTLGAARLGSHQVRQQGFEILAQLHGLEISLAERAVNDARLVGAITNLTCLRVANRLGDIGRHGTDLGVRHQPARTEDLAELTDQAHGIRRGNDDVEVELAGLDVLCEIIEAHAIGAGLGRRVRGRTLREHRHTDGLADAVRQYGRAANDLIGFARVDAEVDRDIDAFGKLDLRQLLEECERIFRRIESAALDALLNRAHTLG